MTDTAIQALRMALLEGDPFAMIAYSPSSYQPGGHVTVVHDVSQADAVDAAILAAGLTGDRIDSTRVRVAQP